MKNAARMTYRLLASTFVTTCLAFAPTDARGADGLSVNLIQESSDSSLEHSLYVGSVMQSGKPSTDLAVCVARFAPGKKPIPVGDPILVAYVDGGEDGVSSMASAGDYCQGKQCTTLALQVSDHNVELDGYPYGTVCADPYRIGERYRLKQVALADLTAVATVKVDIRVYNLYDDGTMMMEIGGGRFRQTCVIPSGDADVRYGRGWLWDGSMTHHYVPTSSLYVCSEGVRVCSFSGDFMENPLSAAEIRGNDENNTIMLSGESADAIDGVRNCVVAADVGGIDHYQVFGWRDTWNGHMRLSGRGGHDWLIGGPTADTIYGGPGDDMLRGAGGSGNRLYGQDGRDIMHDAVDGLCDGGVPEPDAPCFSDAWVWPPRPYPAGDCCCHSCDGHRNCFHSDATPGGPAVAPDPW